MNCILFSALIISLVGFNLPVNFLFSMEQELNKQNNQEIKDLNKEFQEESDTTSTSSENNQLEELEELYLPAEIKENIYDYGTEYLQHLPHLWHVVFNHFCKDVVYTPSIASCNNSIALSSDNRFLAHASTRVNRNQGGSHLKTIINIWKNKKLFQTIIPTNDYCLNFTFSPHNNNIVIISESKKPFEIIIEYYNIETNEVIHTISFNNEPYRIRKVQSIAFSKNGNILLVIESMKWGSINQIPPKLIFLEIDKYTGAIVHEKILLEQEISNSPWFERFELLGSSFITSSGNFLSYFDYKKNTFHLIDIEKQEELKHTFPFLTEMDTYALGKSGTHFASYLNRSSNGGLKVGIATKTSTFFTQIPFPNFIYSLIWHRSNESLIMLLNNKICVLSIEDIYKIDELINSLSAESSYELSLTKIKQLTLLTAFNQSIKDSKDTKQRHRIYADAEQWQTFKTLPEWLQQILGKYIQEPALQ